MHSHTESTYSRFLNCLKDYIKDNIAKGNIPEWEPKVCMCDFERGFMSALTNNKIDMRGCKFHLLQAVRKRLSSLGVDADKQRAVNRILVECFHASTERAFEVALASMFEAAGTDDFKDYFESTWVGHTSQRLLAARWALAYQSKFPSWHPAIIGSVYDEERETVREIHRAATHNLSDGRNKADRDLYDNFGKIKPDLFEQSLVIHRSLNKHCHDYQLLKKKGLHAVVPDTHVVETTTSRATKRL